MQAVSLSRPTDRLLTAPAVAVRYAKHLCDARVASLAGKLDLADAHSEAAGRAQDWTADTEITVLRHITHIMAENPTVTDPATVLRLAGLRVQEGA